MRLPRGKGQAATELAVFGAILIFVLGGILRSAFDAGMSQNQNLKAMRWALLESLHGVRNENKSRDSASVLLIEDRLSPEAGRFGSMERAPMVESGAGTFSNTLFMPMDWLENQNIPVSDIFVNGQHFVFTTARFIVYDVRLAIDPTDGVEKVRFWDLTDNITRFVSKDGNWMEGCIENPPTPCPLFYTIIPRNSSKFCAAEDGCSDMTVSIENRFDLNRNGNFDDDPKDAERENVLWQWRGFKGINSDDYLGINKEDGVYPVFDVDGDRKEEVIFAINDPAIPPNLIHPSILPADIPLVDTDSLTAQRLFVLDSQRGDIDLTVNDFDKIGLGTAHVQVGLQKDVAIYTQTKEGTHLEIREGKAYVPETGAFVRSVHQKDQVDVISRMFQLSNDTGRYCTPAGSPQDTIGGLPRGLPNPVEQCVNSTLTNHAFNCAMDSLTINRTCFDVGTKMLYIRSRIEDKRGRKWVTQTY